MTIATIALVASTVPTGASQTQTALGSFKAKAPARIRLGGQSLTKCSSTPLSYCGRLLVPLDYNAPDGPHIAIRFHYYPAAGGARSSTRTVVPVEGGPGYSTVGSVSSGYLPMYGSLLRRWNLLAVDNRGTGSSTPLFCEALQDFAGRTSTNAFNRAVRKCATALNHRWRYRNGRWAQASSLFGSVAASADLASVIRSLELAKVDVYGDSYGSYFVHVFAGRFPELVRSVVLDATYPTRQLDPFYRSTVGAMPAAFNAVCRRSVACASAARGASWSHLVRLAQALRRRPVSGNVPSFTGDATDVTMNSVGLVDLLSDAAGDTEIYREIDAAARAYLDHGDPLPLLRLYDQRLDHDEAYLGQAADEYSVELYLAVSCTDYPQLFDMSGSTAARKAQLRSAEQSALNSFSPFTVSEWLAQDQNTEAYTACLDWPAPHSAQPAASQTRSLPSTVPVLVLGGELDTWTPTSGAKRVLGAIGGHSRFIELANATHVVGEENTTCGSVLVRAFVANPAAIDRLNATCARTLPAIHAVGSFPTRLSQVAPLATSSRIELSRMELRLGAAAIFTAGDAVARYDSINYASDRGLRGGTATASATSDALRLHNYQLIPGVRVSGTVTLRSTNDPVNGPAANAKLTVTAGRLPPARISANWSTGGANALASAIETIGADRVIGTTPAP
ncbi:MAG: alpha/beta hydrolase [Solirubrobacteraceae bacterium]